MPRRLSPCPDRHRRMANWKAVQRGHPIGALETVPQARYLVEADGDVPCRLHREGDAGRTRCFAENAPRRKTCRLLLPTDAAAAMRFKTGFHVWGLSDGFHGPDAHRVICSAMDPMTGDTDEYDTAVTTPPPGSVLILGPYATDDVRRVAIKCVTLSVLREMNEFVGRLFLPGQNATDYLGQLFVNWNHTHDLTVPTPHMLHRAYETLRRVGHQTVVLDVVAQVQQEYMAEKDRLVAKCQEEPSLMRRVRTTARMFWMYAMYLRRWKGPGTAYPIRAEDTRVRVTRANVSSALKNRFVSAHASGLRLSALERNALPADVVNDEGRLDNMEMQLQEALRLQYDALSDDDRVLVGRAFRCAEPYRMVDGSGHWCSAEGMFDACFGHGHSLATGNRCVRIASLQLLGGVITLALRLYKNPPSWLLHEGILAPVA